MLGFFIAMIMRPPSMLASFGIFIWSGTKEKAFLLSIPFISKLTASLLLSDVYLGPDLSRASVRLISSAY